MSDRRAKKPTAPDPKIVSLRPTGIVPTYETVWPAERSYLNESHKRQSEALVKEMSKKRPRSREAARTQSILLKTMSGRTSSPKAQGDDAGTK
jgi:hypothetical protein